MLTRPQSDVDEMYIYEKCAYTYILHIYNIRFLYVNMHLCKIYMSQQIQNDLAHGC